MDEKIKEHHEGRESDGGEEAKECDGEDSDGESNEAGLFEDVIDVLDFGQLRAIAMETRKDFATRFTAQT